MTLKQFTWLAVATALLAFTVTTFGAYVRLSNAGLSCPDWPGCYGQILVPETEPEIATANANFPERAVDVPRAWKEMVHRYLAGVLGILILVLAVVAWKRRNRPGQLVFVPIALLFLVIFQAILGMWTVTLLLKPLVVTAHLLGGFATLGLLWWLSLRQGKFFLSANAGMHKPSSGRMRFLVMVGLIVLVAQITLGGWTSTNYAALACPDFPTCQGDLVPPLDFDEAFQPWRGLDQNYEGGVLDNTARVTIHFAHRVGAIVVSAYFVLLLIVLFWAGTNAIRGAAVVLLAVLLAQLALGISNIVLYLPLEVAVAHNAVGALLLLVTLTVYHMARPPPSVAV